MTELYVFPPSPRAFKVMVIANHLGIEPTLHVLDLIKGEQKSPQTLHSTPTCGKRCTQPQHADADAARRGLCAVGVERDLTIPRR
jgi:hypothetical protein